MTPLGRPDAEKVLPGFEDINRYYDRSNQMYAAKIKPGEFYVSKSPELIVTVLGSCVSACITDRVNQIGGMNHFMLPVTPGAKSDPTNVTSESARYGNFAMEFLINNIIRNGGERRYLEVKIFGGSKVIKRMSDVGEKNIQFILKYVESEALNVLAKDLGGESPRKVVYNPMNGIVRIKKLRNLHNDTIIRREDNYLHQIEGDTQSAGEIELFD
ncbi:chemoreceptor glutamine deamidase CheD [Pleionea litopenaei]|uniref:Probable chemoreceptor glutamine deamidase CheD n=1 Tax=Pleionea litopenaei TaxID=3070815 RepID=A0AA51RUF2_9GAMM|nr:chemoreceptor glutamine deamidase CheD [Pleionea sp. HL-JVS1]WMS87674.1 chemoreceptor glutamine deamidase CheD [Pleionea sp. HL-JVS1]